MAESCEDSIPRSNIEIEDADEIRSADYMIIGSLSFGEENADRTRDFLKLIDKRSHNADYMIIGSMSIGEENADRTRDFLKLIDKRSHNPFSCSSMYENDHEIRNMEESCGSSGSKSNLEDLITRDFLKLIDGVEEDQEILKMGERGENSNVVSYEEDVRTKDFLKLIDRRRNEGEDQERMKMAKS